MDEEKKAEKVIEKKTDADPNTGDKPKAATIVEQANAVAERMEKANEVRAGLLAKEEELAAQRALGGHSEAGQKVEEKEEETPAEYKARLMSGGLQDN